MIGFDLARIAATYGGTVSGQSVTIPTPGHSRRDRGTIITPMPGAPDGVLVACYNGGQSEALAVKDQLRRDGFLPERDGKRRELTQAERKAIDQQRREAEADRERRHKQVAGRAQAMWRGASPASPAHPYLKRKGLNPLGLRQCGSDLLVPLVDETLQLWNVQRIRPDGAKLFLKGGRVSGLFSPLHVWMAHGRPASGPVVIGEGWATTAAIHEATGLAVATAFNSGNLASVALALRHAFPSRLLIVAADWDGLGGGIGLASARKAAEAANALLAIPVLPDANPASLDAKTDFADISREQAKAFIRAVIEGGR
ncbi:MAG: toprim domain-containing protein [Sphingomonadales bacterium]|nr:toprim domain-containing protein [Sphingomonadales bacterium]MDE2168773.1 toprim domain-containing protein [Sphingomonadales bacterium]